MSDLTLRQAAEILSVTYQGLYGMASSGRFPPAYQVGNRWRVNPELLEKYRHGEYTKPKQQYQPEVSNVWSLKDVKTVTRLDLNSSRKKLEDVVLSVQENKRKNMKTN